MRNGKIPDFLGIPKFQERFEAVRPKTLQDVHSVSGCDGIPTGRDAIKCDQAHIQGFGLSAVALMT